MIFSILTRLITGMFLFAINSVEHGLSGTAVPLTRTDYRKALHLAIHFHMPF